MNLLSACSCSWLDHFSVSNPNMVTGHRIYYGTTVFDHIPISVDLIVPNCHPSLPIQDNMWNTVDKTSKVNWDSLNGDDLNNFSICLDDICIHLCYDVLLCNDQHCEMEEHKRDLEMIYTDILDGILTASEMLPSINGPHKNRVVGWNSYCKSFYNMAREKYLIWHNLGRPRSGIEFEEMKSSRTIFKNTLNFCKNNEKKLRSENLLSKFQNPNKSKFWKEISKINGSKNICAVQVNGEKSIVKVVNILDDPSCQGGANTHDNYP